MIFLSTVDCEDDSSCQDTEVCHNHICIDACRLNSMCPPSAVCVSSDHKGQCQCPPGTTGNPQHQCLIVECIQEDNCRNFEACINGECKEPCAYYNPCAKDAFCRVIDHEPKCECLPGFTGDPRFSCEEPKDPSTCVVDQDCVPTHGCILDSLVTRYHNKVSAVYIRQDDTSSGASCRDLCQEHKPCGPNAVCSVIDSTPRRSMSCSCPPGYHGDAKIECRLSKYCMHAYILLS